MRVKVRSVAPPESGDFETIRAGEELPADSPEPEPAATPVTEAQLGPNGAQVRALLDRAEHLTPGEVRLLEEAAAWRWWPVTPLPASSVAAARGLALVRGRAEGRRAAMAELERAVDEVVRERRKGRARSRLAACIGNAGLALLVRDLIDSETFETLFGPWREVMHH